MSDAVTASVRTRVLPRWLSGAALARCLFAFALVLLAMGTALDVTARNVSDPAVDLGGAVEPRDFVMLALMLPTIAIGGLLATRRPANPVGWIFLISGLALGWAVFSYGYLEYGAGARPGSLPFALALGQTSDFVGSLSFLLPVSFLFLVFPDGRLLSRRLWIAVCAGGVATLMVMVGIALDPRVDGDYPYDKPLALDSSTVPALIAGAGTAIVFLVMGAGLTSLVVRYRHGSLDERLQIKWFGYAAMLLVVSSLVFHVLGPLVLSSGAVKQAGFAAAGVVLMVGLPAAVAIAILRHRLFDIDRLIRRSLVYGILWLTLTVLYAGVAAALGIAAGRRWPVPAAVLLTVAITLGFQPARRRLELLIDRWVYGARASGYELLADLGKSLQAACELEDAVSRLAETVRRGLDLRWARVSLLVEPVAGQPELRPYAASGIDLADPSPAIATTSLVHAGVEVGVIECGPKVEGELTQKDSELLATLAGHAAVAIRNASLAAELSVRLDQIRAQADELAASRSRIVHAQAEERRRTERDIHDGAQQELVGLIAKLRLARDQLRTDVALADDALVDLQRDAQAALQGLRELAQGIHPSVLGDRGLVAALEARADRSPIPVRFYLSEGLRQARFADAIEGAAYFAVSEALTNALKHSAASTIDVTMRLSDDLLRIEIHDDGIGFDPASAEGSGMVGLTDRIEAVGGRLYVDGASGRGTVIAIELHATRRPVTHA